MTSYVYNAAGQILLVDYPPAGSGTGDPGDADVAYTYDALGRLATRTDAAGAWAWTYDGDSGRVLTLTDPDANVLSYTYDAGGQRDAMALTAAGQQQPLMELDYTHAAGRLTGIASSENVGGALRAATYAYEFDRIGNHLRQTKNGTEFRGRYNSLNELVEREVAGAVRVQGAVDGVLPIGVKVDGRAAQTQGVDADTAAFRGDSPLRPRQTGEKAISIVATDSNQPPKRTEARFGQFQKLDHW